MNKIMKFDFFRKKVTSFRVPFLILKKKFKMARNKGWEYQMRTQKVKSHPERPSCIKIIMFILIAAFVIFCCYYASKFNMYMRTIEYEY